MTLIVVSPHLDDAVLSCGQLLAANPGAVVITVFAGIPVGDVPLTDYDVRSGWVSARGAVEGRRDEDRRAASVLGYQAQHLDFLDRQYGVAVNTDTLMRELFNTIRAHVTEAPKHGDVRVVTPLGIAHPDHELAARFSRNVARDLRLTTWVYEELPGRVLHPEAVPEINSAWRRVNPTIGDLAVKEIAVGCYRSQLWALGWHACLVPERYWQCAD